MKNVFYFMLNLKLVTSGQAAGHKITKLVRTKNYDLL
jgi:hypothetical protein